jgi:hypothetical protein
MLEMVTSYFSKDLNYQISPDSISNVAVVEGKAVGNETATLLEIVVSCPDLHKVHIFHVNVHGEDDVEAKEKHEVQVLGMDL